MLNITHTYSILHVSKQTYDEIDTLLRACGYNHAFMGRGEIDMHGIVLLPIEDDFNDKLLQILNSNWPTKNKTDSDIVDRATALAKQLLNWIEG